MKTNIIKINTTEIIESAIPIENYYGVLQYICDDFKRSVRLSKYLKKELTKAFGKHNGRFKSEFFYYVWVVEFDGERFQIFTDNEKGTEFCIIAKRGSLYDANKSIVCINFLKEIEKFLM